MSDIATELAVGWMEKNRKQQATIDALVNMVDEMETCQECAQKKCSSCGVEARRIQLIALAKGAK